MKKRIRMPENDLEGITPRDQGGSSKCTTVPAFCTRSQQWVGPPILALANENPPIPPEAAGDMPLIGLANDFVVLQDKWLLIPYAQVPVSFGGRRYLQDLNLANARELVARFGSWRGQITRRFAGLPFFVGHPDHEEFADQHTDRKSYGWIKELDARHDGLALSVDWSEPGQVLVANAHYKFFSPNFYARRTGEKKDGMEIAEPVWLKSCGLTNDPNWPVYPLANEDNNKGGSSMELLQRLVAILGLKEGGSEDDVVSAITKLVEAAKKIKEAVEAKWDAEDAAREALPNEIPIDEAIGKILVLVGDGELALANATSAKTEIETSLAAEKDARTAAEEALAAERKERIVLLVNEALTSGKILPADKDKWLKDLEEDFDVKHQVLANARPALKTTLKTGNLGERDSSVKSKEDEILTLVNARMEETGKQFTEAWLAVKKDNPALFQAKQEEEGN